MADTIEFDNKTYIKLSRQKNVRGTFDILLDRDRNYKFLKVIANHNGEIYEEVLETSLLKFLYDKYLVKPTDFFER